jgi:hypothetical protein
VEELGHPLEGQVLRHDDQHPIGEPELAQAGEDQAGLDGLAEPDLVGQHEARAPVGEDAPGGADLVREDVDAGGEERAQAVGAAHGLEADHPGAEREGAGRAGVARGQPVEQATGRPVERGLVGDGDEGPVATGDHGHSLAAGEADGESAGVLAHLQHDAHAPRGLGPVDELLPLLPAHAVRSSTPSSGAKPFI